VPGRVRVVARFFEASGALGIVLLVGLACGNLLVGDWMRSHGAPALTIPQLLAVSGALVASYWVGRRLARGERAGALGVLLAFAATLVRWLTGDTSDLLAVGIGAVASVAVLTSWRELD
jgi:4-amino-4-deoxy-L-arabinose transferase-like glycosyltransferase